MIHFIDSTREISILLENLEIVRSMIETSMPEIASDDSLKFRRGSSIVTCDKNRILLQRQTGPKLSESLQCSYSLGILAGLLDGNALNQAIVVMIADEIFEILRNAAISTRTGDPFEQIPGELLDIFALHALAANLHDRHSHAEIQLSFPTPYVSMMPPIALIELDGGQFRLPESTLSTISAEIPRALLCETTKLEDVGRSSWTLSISGFGLTIALADQVSVIEQMKALAKFNLSEADLSLEPFGSA